ncbi:MAG: ArsR/SmtB family transcription factor [Bacillota bacterium]|uniref:Winged helix-turn-helix transcriptional regulator n=1 Tax=Virgibacillus salarius TaxID=447199 RepID=A0A941DVM8_9BACI|nr:MULTISPECIES: metalloregulator ArsR/SmtB family transcription factor [Bacillaceae]MBR7798144.1 winged helix-turn-helix transcriptional regulator [Virgibacillus salarius]MCC2251364.1 ArsR family transcriptional regulator [Virgibacillus sp. AGTR]NAZ10852.1 ArsR family transcriptional regulator [Agaribacter marinus]WBX79930.1 metalloregulator ArsR/SmtB family transcription factor [Virgibacillus salarius]
MDLLTTGVKREREKYTVEIKSSLLWESALGIAAITNTSLISTLDLSEKDYELISQSLSKNMKEQLDYVQANNTWKTLLQILHQEDFKDLASFNNYVKSLSSIELKWIAIPYLGKEGEILKKELLKGSKDALRELKYITKDHTFLPTYLEFIHKVSIEKLKAHLIEVMSGWFKAIIEPHKVKLESILLRDKALKEKMLKNFEPDQFVEWATDGVQYPPEPSVHKVLLIPHYIYRPWNVEADLEGVKVFYYAVANESISDKSKFVPNKLLVQRFKALGDENRLKILKMIKENNVTLQELTTKLQLGKTTVHHHLKILKSARLVSQSLNEYVLVDKAIENLPMELKFYLESE